MSPCPCVGHGCARPNPDRVNDRIRRLVDEAGGAWPAEEYEVLLRQWAAATRDDVTEAA
ncbi:hypothetical protein [Streptomyces sp. GC420]|uniref:hypothetical protein n=1 Tax=Streptomyces sp. GC420 TaxID=2697568 RepID=UPI001414DB41|nr:hypothetical protein [Streptomyces sp. GC420]NBM17722.1 hypothetical protein [Streptomyces sp. GC420]